MANLKKRCIVDFLKQINSEETLTMLLNIVESAYKEERGADNE